MHNRYTIMAKNKDGNKQKDIKYVNSWQMCHQVTSIKRKRFIPPKRRDNLLQYTNRIPRGIRADSYGGTGCLLVLLHLQIAPQGAQRVQGQGLHFVFAGIDADGGQERDALLQA